MNRATGYMFVTSDSLCNYTINGAEASFSSILAIDHQQNQTPPAPAPPGVSDSVSLRMAMRISRARWYSFLRWVFYHQNNVNGGPTMLPQNLVVDYSNSPFNSATWMVIKFVALSVQILIIAYTLNVSKDETPVWTMRVWISGYQLGSILNLILLYWRYRLIYLRPVQQAGSDGDGGDDDGGHTRASHLSDHHYELSIINEQQQSIRRSSTNNYEQFSTSCRGSLKFMNKFLTCIELFFAVWFVMGNVWVFDTRFRSFNRAPKLHLLCIFLLAWNAISYSFPFILFLLLCCCVPLLSNLLGYNINNIGSIHRGASEEQLSELSKWIYTDDVGGTNLEHGKFVPENDQNQECCICLSKYKDKEELRQLPCTHIFHLKCVDQWLRIISCCPLCKQELQR